MHPGSFRPIFPAEMYIYAKSGDRAMPVPDRSLSTAEARDRFSEVLNRAAFGKERVVLTRRGRPLAAMVPIEDVESLEALEDARDAAELRARLAEWREAGREVVSLEEVARKHGLVPDAAEE